jgi:DNA-binding MarR family transcriptional regulator
MNRLVTEGSPGDIRALADLLRPALLRASRSLRREVLRAGVSALDAHLLGVVRKNPGIGVSGVAELEQVSSASISVHFKRLVQAGWIERLAGADDDRRRAGLKITAAGLKALEAIRRRRNDWLAAHLARLNPDERAALAAAAGPLQRLVEDRP